MPKKVCLVLGSGAARGLAHIGVIKVLEQNNIKVDCIIGCSIGALVGAVYAGEGTIKGLSEFASKFDKKASRQLFDWGLSKQGLIKGQRIKTFLKNTLKNDFSELKIPLTVVATDIKEKQLVKIESGSLVDAVMASISVPVLFAPQKNGDRLFVDGGIMNPLPINIAEEKGMDIIIAVDVEFKVEKVTTGIVSIGVNSIMLMKQQIAELTKKIYSTKSNVVIISPEMKDTIYWDFGLGAELMVCGETAAKAALPRIMALLNEQK
jgi:NTE family protein